jgi:hypothetical protein
VGLFDAVRALLGSRASADASRDADPEDLWGMSTAYLTMEAELGFAPVGEAALCFADVDSTDFRDTVEEVMALLDTAEVETGTGYHLHEDDHGYSWVVLEDEVTEDVITSIHFVADTFVDRDYGSRLLAAVFGFERADDDAVAYWVYSFRRGAYYPFAPAGDRERDHGVEFKLESQLAGELDVEPDEEYWYPLWPSARGTHPWE